MADDALLSQFSDLTGAAPETAQSYLSAASNNLEEAVSTYFAAQEGEDQPAPSSPGSSWGSLISS